MALLVLVLSACREAVEAPEAGGPPARPVEKTAQRGPVLVTVRADRGEMTVADVLGVSFEVVAPPGYEIALPASSEALGVFRVRAARDEAAVPVERGRLWRRRYELLVDAPGEFQIPPVTVRWAGSGSRPAGAPASQPAAEIASEPLPIRVASVLTGEFRPGEFSDIRGPVALPWRPGSGWIWPVIGVLCAGAAGAVGWRLWRRRAARVAAAPAVPPHVRALEELRRLRAEGLIERQRVAELYFRLTAIVRVYIERRFAVRAAEQTTEEFLAAARDHPALGVRHGGLLAGFLRAADLVKFARYEPDAAQIEGAFASAETFVRATVPPEQGESPEAAGPAPPGAAGRPA